MKYRTFENRLLEVTEMEHQHLSNIYWFQTLINNVRCPIDIMLQLETRFGGEILSYKPKPNFKQEIDLLDEKGFLSWKTLGTARIADIIYGGEIIGQACYLEDQRQFLIETIIN